MPSDTQQFSERSAHHPLTRHTTHAEAAMGKRRRATAEPAAAAAPCSDGASQMAAAEDAAEHMNEYERARAARIAANTARMEVRA